MNNLNKNQMIIIGVIIIIIIITIGGYLSKTIKNNEYEELEIESLEETGSNDIVKESQKEIIIHITGCVVNEGLIKLKDGDRLADAIEKAGGTTLEANLKKINLAYKLKDEQKIYIPSILDENYEEESENIIEDNIIIDDTNVISGEETEEKININDATQTELETLPGIGPATSYKIIQYREEIGKYKQIEDIKQVSGIGEAKYNNIKNFITI